MIRLHDVIPGFDFHITGGGTYNQECFPDGCYLDLCDGYANVVYEPDSKLVYLVSLAIHTDHYLIWVNPDYQEAWQAMMDDPETRMGDEHTIVTYCELSKIWEVVEFDQMAKQQQIIK